MQCTKPQRHGRLERVMQRSQGLRAHFTLELVEKLRLGGGVSILGNRQRRCSGTESCFIGP